MDYENLNGFSLKNLGQKNIIIGKNGCGKSFLLKAIEQEIKVAGIQKVRYISPERGGELLYDASLDQEMLNSRWEESRRKNQLGNFRQQSVALYTKLENKILRNIEKERKKGDFSQSFDDIVDKINSLLERVKIERFNIGFKFNLKDGGDETPANLISSGEAELVSLAIEFLSFKKECDGLKQSLLLIDEPDVHLHPDLQDRLAQFISKEISGPDLTVIIASHSTPFVGALARGNNANVAFMKRGDTELNFTDIGVIMKKILPIFGAHPLSNVFNEAPILIVEGEDDERIWQQAVRSSNGGIILYPCVADGIDQMGSFEEEANSIIETIYDDAKGYSLRDRDDSPEDINNLRSIKRMRLSCRASENLLLSDDVLLHAKTDWESLKNQIELFVEKSDHHPCHKEMNDFLNDGLNRKSANLKKIRMVLAGFISNKPWEVLVGQTISSIYKNGGLGGDNSLQAYLGVTVCEQLLSLKNA